VCYGSIAYFETPITQLGLGENVVTNRQSDVLDENKARFISAISDEVK